MIENYTYKARRKENPAAYREKKPELGALEWVSVEEGLPPKSHHVLAWDGNRVAEAWLNADGVFMRVNAKWERVFGTKVLKWSAMPKPE